jgi:RNA polymerase sigma-70 factor (ECF subfamily)
MSSIASVVESERLDDLSLARRIAERERMAFELLMRRYNRRLFRLAYAVLGNEAEAEDALQEGYLQAYRSIHAFRGDAALSTWLSRLILNEAIARLRRSQRRSKVVPLSSAEDNLKALASVADDSPQPEAVMGRLQMRALLERKVSELPEAFRLVFMLRSVEELSVQEVSKILDIPEETVRSRHYRARSLLRESLAREFDLTERDLFEFGGVRCDRIVARTLAQLEESSGFPQTPEH